MAEKSKLYWIALILVIIGGLNYGLMVLGLDVIQQVLGGIPIIRDIVYALIGLSALFMIFNAKK